MKEACPGAGTRFLFGVYGAKARCCSRCDTWCVLGAFRAGVQGKAPGAFLPTLPHSWPRLGPAKDPTAVCNNKIPCVWERGISASGKGLLKEIPGFHHPLNPGAV